MVEENYRFDSETVFPMLPLPQFDSIEECFAKLPPEEHEFVIRTLYGNGCFPKELPPKTGQAAKESGLDVALYGFKSKREQLRSPRIVRIAGMQHKMPAPTNAPLEEQKNANYQLAREALAIAAEANVNIFCFEEFWYIPYGIATRETLPWTEFTENAETGPTIQFLKTLARQYNMVIISPILERDENHADVVWDTAVIIDNHGEYLGKHRKNHIPRTFYYNESRYYFEGNDGHPVFETEFGKIAVNICFGHHHNLNWLMFGLNGAEIVFNPSACNTWHEPIWPVLARNAAVTNGYFAVAINRPGDQIFEDEFTGGDGKPARNDLHWYGSSYIASPDGSRTPGLSRKRNGIIMADIDLNLCRQTKDLFGIRMTMRLDLYAKSLMRTLDVDYKQQIVKKRPDRSALNYDRIVNNDFDRYDRSERFDRSNSSF